MRHVHHQVGADLVGDAAEGFEVQLARVGGPAGDDQLGPVLQGRGAHGVHVAPERLPVHAVCGDLVQPATEVDLHAVGQVPAVRQLQAEDGVALADQRVHRRGVGLRAGVRLHVGVAGAEQRPDPVPGQVLGDVHVLAAAVVALAGVALGVLVGQHAALRLEHGPGGEVLAGDHLQRAALPAELAGQDGGELGIGLGERGGGHLLRGCHGLGHGLRLLAVRMRSSERCSPDARGPGERPAGRRHCRFPVVAHPNASRGRVRLPARPGQPLAAHPWNRRDPAALVAPSRRFQGHTASGTGGRYSRPREVTASRSSTSSATEASIRARLKPEMSRPGTILHCPPSEVAGNDEIRPSGTP